MLKSERDFYLGKAHGIVETFYQGKDRQQILDALIDASRIIANQTIDELGSSWQKHIQLQNVVENFLKYSSTQAKELPGAFNPYLREMESALAAVKHGQR